MSVETVKADSHTEGFAFHFFSEIRRRPVRTPDGKKIGRLHDMVISLQEALPEVVGVLVAPGRGDPIFFVPWKTVSAVTPQGLTVKPLAPGPFLPFVDEKGWMLLEEHLMGRSVLDIDGRRLEAVNDVQLLESHGRMVVVHVDTSLNGFLRRWGLGKRVLMRDHLISWKYVQPFTIEDKVARDVLALSLARDQIHDLPAEDLADVLEELHDTEQKALFAALEPATAAQALAEAEPRAQRQLVASMPPERAGAVLAELSVPQIADLFSVLPLDRANVLATVLPAETRDRVQAIRSQRDVVARALMGSDCVTTDRRRRVGDVLQELRRSGREPHAISYVYVVEGGSRTLIGVVDLRELVLANDATTIGDVMTSPVVTVDEGQRREDVQALFSKYHYRMVPVVDSKDSLLGVVLYGDVMKGIESREAR